MIGRGCRRIIASFSLKRFETDERAKFLLQPRAWAGEARQFGYTHAQCPLGSALIRPKISPDLHQIDRRRQHDAVGDRGADQQGGDDPVLDYVNGDRQTKIEQQIDIELVYQRCD